MGARSVQQSPHPLTRLSHFTQSSWRTPLRATLLSLAILALGASPLCADEKASLIPRDVLFGNPDRAGAQISRDGKYLSYLSPDDKNVLQVWIQPVGGGVARKLTNDPKRGIRQYYWAYDNKNLLYLQDNDGDENFHLFMVDVDSGKTTELTPDKGVRVQSVMLEERHPTIVAFTMNKRDRRLFDLYKADLSSGKLTLIEENKNNVLGYTLDADMQPRAILSMDMNEGSQILFVRDDVKQPWRKLRTWPAEEQGGPGGFS